MVLYWQIADSLFCPALHAVCLHSLCMFKFYRIPSIHGSDLWFNKPGWNALHHLLHWFHNLDFLQLYWETWKVALRDSSWIAVSIWCLDYGEPFESDCRPRWVNPKMDILSIQWSALTVYKLVKSCEQFFLYGIKTAGAALSVKSMAERGNLLWPLVLQYKINRATSNIVEGHAETVAKNTWWQEMWGYFMWVAYWGGRSPGEIK